MSSTLVDAIAKYHWYQSIPLGDDLKTPGETGDATENKLAMMQLPDDMSDQRVLDIGCNEGFFAFECERRGAKRVVAVDKGVDAREKFELIRQIKNSHVEFLPLDLYDIGPAAFGKFDVVFFLAVLHHVKYPMLALDRVAALTRGYAIIEAVEAVSKDYEDQSVLVRRMSKKGHLHWLPTRTLLLEVLEKSGFKKVEVLGTHRQQKAGPERKMPGYSLQRVLVKAHRQEG